MTEEQIKEYRKLVATDYTEKERDIETSMSYISIGALGFFLTINEKFIHLVEAKCKLLLIISLLFLLISFVLILIRKSRASHHDMKLLDFIDNNLIPNTTDDLRLLEKWKISHQELAKIKNCIYVCLGIGVGLQVLFLVINLK